MQFITGRKHGQSLGAFSRETKLTKILQKLSKKIHGQTKGGGGCTIATSPPPKYATVDIDEHLICCCLFLIVFLSEQ